MIIVTRLQLLLLEVNIETHFAFPSKSTISSFFSVTSDLYFFCPLPEEKYSPMAFHLNVQKVGFPISCDNKLLLQLSEIIHIVTVNFL
jgi:hypothetical protein